MDTSIRSGNYFQMYIDGVYISNGVIEIMLENNVILITGGGSGIGEALALQLADNNTVIICGRNEQKLKTVSSKKATITHHVADLSDFTSINQLFQTLGEKKIVLDVLFNNAGVVELWDLTDQKLEPKEIFEKVNTNFSGAIAMIQLFINQARRDVPNMIVNITTEVAILPVPILPLYSASKAALSVFTKSLRLQLKETSFKVVEILPPGVDTDMPKKLNVKGRLRDPSLFAQHIIRAVRDGKQEYAPGDNVVLLKFMRRLFPTSGLKLIDKMSRRQLLSK